MFLVDTNVISELKMVTRNVHDFTTTGVETVNPWEE